MKKLFSILSVMMMALLLLSCRTTSNVSTKDKLVFEADSLSSVYVCEKVDSTNYYLKQLDSLNNQLENYRLQIIHLQIQDSISKSTHRVDSVYVKDSTVVQINADGSKNTTTVRETNRVSLEVQKEIVKRVQKEYQRTIDSLVNVISEKDYTIELLDHYYQDRDSANIYKSQVDSMQNIIESEKTIVKEEPWYQKIFDSIGYIFIIGVLAIGGVFFVQWIRK